MHSNDFTPRSTIKAKSAPNGGGEWTKNTGKVPKTGKKNRVNSTTIGQNQKPATKGNEKTEKTTTTKTVGGTTIGGDQKSATKGKNEKSKKTTTTKTESTTKKTGTPGWIKY